MQTTTAMKCTTCCIPFGNVDDMRKHYQTEYHLNNVRLRVEGKPVITQTEFRHSGAGSAKMLGADPIDGPTDAPVFSCTLCKKAFRSMQTLQSHVKSTAHLMKKEQRILARDSDAASMLTTTSLGSAAIGLHRRFKMHKAKKHKDPNGSAIKEVPVAEREEDVD